MSSSLVNRMKGGRPERQAQEDGLYAGRRQPHSEGRSTAEGRGRSPLHRH